MSNKTGVSARSASLYFFLRVSSSLGLLMWCAAAHSQEAADGALVFATSCVTCHNGSPDSRAPTLAALHDTSPEAVVRALVGGTMRLAGAHLSGGERRAVAEFVTGQKYHDELVDPTVGRCASPPAPYQGGGPRWNGWSPSVENSHFQNAEQAGLLPRQIPDLKLKWAFGLPDTSTAYGPVSVVSGRLYVGGQNGNVYMLDAKSGCTYWTFAATGSVRTAITIAPGTLATDGNVAQNAYFSDINGYVTAINADTGTLVWRTKVESHPGVRMTGSPVVYKGVVYAPTASFEESLAFDPHYRCCSFRGSITALSAATGRLVWQTYTVPQAKPMGVNKIGTPVTGPAGGGIWATPTIDVKRQRLYVGVGNTYMGDMQPLTDSEIALDLKTGKVIWATQASLNDLYSGGCLHVSGCVMGADADFGTTAVLGKLANGNDVLFTASKAGLGFALDIDTGKILWSYRAGYGGVQGGIVWGTAYDGQNVYFPNSDVYERSPGGLHAVNAMTGKSVWEAPKSDLLCPAQPPLGPTGGPTCNRALSAAITVIPGAVFAPSNDGGLRAYSTLDGTVLWTFDTNTTFQTINGVKANGGSMLAAGPVVVGGMVYVSSGYGYNGGRPGNVLLAFGLDASDHTDSP